MFYYPADVVLVLVVVGATVVVDVVVVGATVVVLDVVVGLQHSYAVISFHLPTLGIFFLRIRLLGTTLPLPSMRAKARNLLSFELLIFIYFINFYNSW
jgi:hypothetical protein